MYKSYSLKTIVSVLNTMILNDDMKYATDNNNRYFIHYQKHISTDLIYKHNIKNIFLLPKIQKIVLNTMHKTIINDKKNIIPFLSSLQIISQQKLKVTSAHKNISFFKIRKNQKIGVKSDLRNRKMFEFLEKLVYIILPETRDFDGIKNTNLNKSAFFTISLNDILNFPELDNYFEYFAKINQFDISFILNVKNKKTYKTKKESLFVSHYKNNEQSNDLKTLNFLRCFQIPTKYTK